MGNRGGLGLDWLGDITAISERVKNCEIRDIYSLTISSAIVLHCVGLRREFEVPLLCG